MPHPTQKPIELFERPIKNHLKRGEAVYDPFNGSGTNLMAAEINGRIAFGCELDPRYCDVAVDRWENATGGKAKKVKA
jgi:DNA modification methylase